MKKYKAGAYLLIALSLGATGNAFSMGLRSLVALPVEKGGGVVRFSLVHSKEADSLISSAAYGLSNKQTLLFGLPYRLSPSGNNRQGDLSLLYRHISYQKDTSSGTDRLGLLGGVVIPTKNETDPAVQAGFVFTHFKNRNEIDIDAVYQVGLKNRLDSGRYDISWQYRLSPQERPDWGIVKELNSVVELNGRWTEGNEITHQITLGLQRVDKKWVIDGGITQDINNKRDVSFLMSTRFHF